MSQYLVNFNVQAPDKTLSQDDSVNWLKSYMPEKYGRKIDRFSVSSNYIAQRMLFSATGIGEYKSTENNMYSFNEDKQPSLSDRAQIAHSVFNKIFDETYKEAQHAPDQLIHVSCTHYQSPSSAQELVAKKKWNKETSVTHVYHMGCYAALPAIRVARGYNASGSGRVDIVHTEMCSLHLDKEDASAEQVIMKSLFSDGAIRYSSLDEEAFKRSERPGLKVLALHEELVADSKDEMTWKLTPACFSMTLSTKVPRLLAETINEFMSVMFKKAGFDFAKDKNAFSFAIHPGGPKIVDQVQEVLNLEEDQIQYSKEILSSRGNMSSATLPHIWDQTLLREDREYVCSVAFGPGLTITGAMFKICKP